MTPQPGRSYRSTVAKSEQQQQPQPQQASSAAANNTTLNTAQLSQRARVLDTAVEQLQQNGTQLTDRIDKLSVTLELLPPLLETTLNDALSDTDSQGRRQHTEGPAGQHLYSAGWPFYCCTCTAQGLRQGICRAGPHSANSALHLEFRFGVVHPL